MFNHGYLKEENTKLKEELTRLRSHRDVLENLNKSLQNEINDFIEVNESVRMQLDKKTEVSRIYDD
jgi:FtsZ-binding cell division protein ZapB